jgi:hypothetical protein
MLKAANVIPLSVKRDATVTEATTLMAMNDFSQLPVMQTERDVVGMITWKSLGMEHVRNRRPEFVRQCMDEPPEILGVEVPLLDAVATVAKHELVLVKDTDRKIVGLVTTTDITDEFHALAEPFLLLGEFENHIRRLIHSKFHMHELKAVRNPSDSEREVKAVSDLTFGEYIRLREAPENWSKLGFAIHRAQFIARLSAIRLIRNEVMHFHPDPLSEAQLLTLRGTVKFMQALGSGGD